jgi:hypothetical protein
VHCVEPTYPRNNLTRILQNTDKYKSRLMHYYPTDYNTDSQNPLWCGWHKDYSCITGLTPALYVDSRVEVIEVNDPESGLFV